MNVHRNSFGQMRRLVDGPLASIADRLYGAAVDAARDADDDEQVSAAAQAAGERVERIEAARKSCVANEWDVGVDLLVSLLVDGKVAITGPEYRLLREAARWVRVPGHPLAGLPLQPLGGHNPARVRESVQIIGTLYGRRVAGAMGADAARWSDLGTVEAVSMVEQVITSLGVSGALVGYRDRRILVQLADAMGIDLALVARIPLAAVPDEDGGERI